MTLSPGPEGTDEAICKTHNSGTENIEDDEADHSDDSSHHCGNHYQENEQSLHGDQLQYGECSSLATVRGRASSYHLSVCRSTSSLVSEGEFHASEKDLRGASLTITTPCTTETNPRTSLTNDLIITPPNVLVYCVIFMIYCQSLPQ